MEKRVDKLLKFFRSILLTVPEKERKSGGSKTMKKLLLILLPAVFVLSAAAGDFDGKGWISGWRFAPLQVDVGLINDKKLVDENTDTFLSLGFFLLHQKSAAVSYSCVANVLHNNYGIQLPPLILGSLTDNNYGISFGWQNYCKNCYGIQVGILNNSWAGEPIEENRKRVQILGANIADTIYLGLVNISNKFQIGILNLGPGAVFQIGLLNYNPKSYIPWLPLVNWNMGRVVKNDKAR